MQQLIFTSVVFFFVIWSSAEAALPEPSCQNKTCPNSEICRIGEFCDAPHNSCAVKAICLTQEDNRNAGDMEGCKIGAPLLEVKAGGGYQMNVCYTAKNCRDGFYCSTAIADGLSRCCRSADLASTPKAGSCPAPHNFERHFCVDQCRSDADCPWTQKCCQNTVSCHRGVCKNPAL